MASRGLGLERLLVVILTIALGIGLAGCGISLNPRPTGPSDPELALASPTAGLTPAATPDPADAALPQPTPTAAPTPAPTPAAPPTVGPTAAPTAGAPSSAPTAAPTAGAPSSAPTAAPTAPRPTAAPTPTPSGGTGGVPAGNARATRIVVPALGIDLPVIKGDPAYPKCNVAQYMVGDWFMNPGRPGATYIYGHARKGMFLPLLDRSKVNDGASMIGMTVRLYTADRKLHTYVITVVKRHATDFSLALNLKPGQHRLIMQTSEGPRGTVPKLQVAARPTGVHDSTAAAALPSPHPVRC